MGLGVRLSPPVLALGAAVLVVIGIGALARALQSGGDARRTPADARGFRSCAPAADDDLLSSEALECWLASTNGRWRILSIDSANGAMVIDVAATSARDADEIAGRLVRATSGRFSEVLVYVREEVVGARAGAVLRIRWTRRHGYEELRLAP